MVVAGLQAAESGLLVGQYNSLGVSLPGNFFEYTMSVVPWKATKEDIDFRVWLALMKEKKFPTGDWVCVVSDEICGKVQVSKYHYNDELNQYVALGFQETLNLKNLSFDSCSYVVYTVGCTNLNHFDLGNKVLGKIFKKEVPCVVNYPDNKRAIASSLLKDKKVKIFEMSDDAKSKFFVRGVEFCASVFVYCIEPFAALLL